MNRLQEHFTARGLGQVLLLALLADLTIRPFGQGSSTTAQQMLPAAVLDTSVTLALMLPVLALARRAALCPAPGAHGADARHRSRLCLLALLAAVFALGGAEGIVRMEGFLRYVSEEPLAHGLVYGLLLAATGYAMWCGPQALARASGPLLCLFALSAVLLVLSNARAMRLENLSAAPFRLDGVMRAAAGGFRLPAELAVFAFFVPEAEGRPARACRNALWCLCVVYMVLTLTAELVLGAQAQVQSQPVHALARLGHLSVFRRLDAAHLAVWVLAGLGKAAAFALALRRAFGLLLPASRRRWAPFCALAALAAGIGVCAALSYGAAEGVLTVLTGLALAALAICGVRGGKRGHDAA